MGGVGFLATLLPAWVWASAVQYGTSKHDDGASKRAVADIHEWSLLFLWENGKTESMSSSNVKSCKTLRAGGSSNLVGVDFVGPQMGGFSDPNLDKYNIILYADPHCTHMAETHQGGGWHHADRAIPVRAFELWNHT
ncbi:hypothetical protein AOQ84DRAFT_414252 [Glonium stellatum]|uniref:Uncharacterized protein n=1 Tax=Glonium stellatum TaxID=574774 RepID=A0A8E2FDI4_9PEZI|nr:hypothetical protein AOQ84DRAFT_414252 [Glonium stellatum]